MIKKTVKAKAAPAPARGGEKVRFQCPCGTGLRVPVARVNGHGRCPICKNRLLLQGKRDKNGKWILKALLLGDSDVSGQTFLMEGTLSTPAVKPPTRTAAPKPASRIPPQKSYRIEDHFQEISELPSKIPFKCPCGRKLVARPAMVDKRGKCPWCNTRLLLVGKTNPRSRKLEIHPLALDAHRSGDTMVLDA